MNIGIIGCGHIARKMASTVNQLDGFTLYAVSSRSIEKAVEFKNEFHAQKAYGSYLELVSDRNVDLVYIATPHSVHYEQMLLCLEHNKPVLCEKIITTSSYDTKDIYKKFEEKGLFLCEALWTSFMPSRKYIQNIIEQNEIGDITSMEACYEIPLMHKERLRLKSLGGGAAMDIGVYPISFILRTLGFNYDECRVMAVEELNGVDSKEIVEFTYGEVKATCFIDATEHGSRDVKIYGTKGSIYIDSVNSPSRISILDSNGNEIRAIECAPPLGGFEYELIASKEAIEAGRIEAIGWTHDNSISVSVVVDKIIS